MALLIFTAHYLLVKTTCFSDPMESSSAAVSQVSQTFCCSCDIGIAAGYSTITIIIVNIEEHCMKFQVLTRATLFNESLADVNVLVWYPASEQVDTLSSCKQGKQRLSPMQKCFSQHSPIKVQHCHYLGLINIQSSFCINKTNSSLHFGLQPIQRNINLHFPYIFHSFFRLFLYFYFSSSFLSSTLCHIDNFNLKYVSYQKIQPFIC